MLAPDDRELLSSALVAPDGYVFDRGLGTTYGLDLTMLLRVPLFLALSTEGDAQDGDGLELLESIERIASRLVVFAQAGHVTTSGSHFRLYGLLEDSVIEAATPNGSFHPKVWLLRFTSDDGPPRLRLLVMSKNLTAARTWDVAVTLDGVIGQAAREVNAPLVEWLEALPGFVVRSGDRERAQLAAELAGDVSRARWNLPDGADRLAFHPFIPGRTWSPSVADRLAVVSPFVRAGALQHVSSKAKIATVLVTRADELPHIRKRDHGFDAVRVLHDAAEDSTDDVTPDDAFDMAGYGLHAKLYAWESSGNFHIAAGSANATNAALLNGVNNEFLVELSGPIGAFGSLDALFGDDGLGSVLMDVDPDEAPELEDDTEASTQLEGARRRLARLALELSCEPHGNEWVLTINPQHTLDLTGIDSLTVWPITAGEAAYAVAADGLSSGEPIRLKPLPLASVTTFVVFRLTNDSGSLRAVVNLPCRDLPEGRNAAIVTSIVSDRGAFMRYVRLLLHDPDDPAAFLDKLEQREPALPGGGGGSSGFSDTPILEDLVRAYSRHPERLKLIGRRIERILESPDAEDIIPQDFLETWAVFEQALKERSDG